MAHGFTDKHGKFRPTGHGKQISKREKTLRSAGIPIDDFDTSFLRTPEGDRQLGERIERERKSRIEEEKEERRVQRLTDKIRELEQQFGDQLIIGINSPLSTEEFVELNNLLVEEQDMMFEIERGKKVLPMKTERRIEELLDRLPFNDVEALRQIQGDGGLERETVEGFKQRQRRVQDAIDSGEMDRFG